MIPHRSRLFRLALTAVLLTAALSAAAQIVNRLGVNDSVFQRWAYCRMQPYDAGKTPENTIMGMVSHEGLKGDAGALQNGFMNGYSNPLAHTGPWNLGTHRGLGFFGLVAGHLHVSSVKEIRNAFDTQANPSNEVYASMVQVASAYASNRPRRASA